jgi:hypothetical protein
MINLMYLVLTALLALNVSREVLNAFANINRSIGRTNAMADSRNKGSLTLFDRELSKKLAPEKMARIQEGKTQATALHAQTEAMVKSLQDIRAKLVEEAGGMNKNLETGELELKRPEDIDASTRYMVDAKKGDQMKNELTAYKSAISKLIPSIDTNSGKLYYNAADQATLESTLPIDFTINKNSDNKGSWSYANFHQVPAIGAVTLIDKYINDVYNSEAIVLDEIYAAAMGETNYLPHPNLYKDPPKPSMAGEKKEDNPDKMVFDKYTAITKPSANYVLPGETFTAQIMVGAYKAKDNQTSILVNGRNVPVVNGVATYTETAVGEGEKILNITGSYFDPNKNGRQNLEGTNKLSYFVGAPGATISLDKMNVFYREVDNPISTSASGILLQNLALNVPTGVEKRSIGGGQYIIDVTNYPQKDLTIGLSAPRGDGKNQDFGGRKYRVKDIPNPILKVGGKPGGAIPSVAFKPQLGPEAVLENFDFDAKFTVESFSFGYTLRKSGEYDEIQNEGPLFNSKVKTVMERLRPKDKVYLENVRVKSPRGKIRVIPNISFTMI